MVTQALASTTEDDLLKMMVTVRDELTKIIEKHQWVEFAPDIPNDDEIVSQLKALKEQSDKDGIVFG